MIRMHVFFTLCLGLTADVVIQPSNRVSYNSTTTFTYLTDEEKLERYQNLKQVQKEMARKLQAFEEREEKLKSSAASRMTTTLATESNQFRAPLLPWPFYLNYNPSVAKDYAMPVAGTDAKATSSPKASAKGGSKKAEKGSSKKAKRKSSSAQPVVEDGTLHLPEPGGKPKEEEVGTEAKEGDHGEAEEVVDIAEEPLDEASVGSGLASPSKNAGISEAELEGHLV